MAADEGGTPGATVGLSQAAAIAGVSISTLRRWANDGRMPSYRTRGGHRRFRTADLQQAITQVSPAAAGAFGALAVSRIRRQLGASRVRDFDWLAGMDEQARERLRLLGRNLLTTIEAYLSARRPRAAVLAEARQFGLLYGRELASAGSGIRQAIEAFTFFRRSIEEAARRYADQQHPQTGSVTSSATSPSTSYEDLRDQLDALNDRMLLGIAEAYEAEARPVAPAVGAE